MRVGTRLFGRVYKNNQRPIATKFLHIYHLPLIPLGTYEILDDREDIANPTSFSMLSLFAAYFKAWGAIFAVAISVWAFVELTAGESDRAYWLPFVALGAMGSVIASWLWLGNPPPTGRADRIKTAVLSLGLPLALMTGAYGYGFVRRMEVGPIFEPLVEPPNPAGDSQEQRIVERSVKRSAYQDLLYPIARAHYEKKAWTKSSCDDTTIAGATEPKSSELLLVEYNFIGKILNPADTRPSMRAWLVSEALKDLATVEIPDGTFDRLDGHRYLGVVSVRQERRLSKKRSIIEGHLVIYDLITHHAMCETPVKVTGRGAPEQLRRKFVARIEKKLREITKALQLERPRLARR